MRRIALMAMIAASLIVVSLAANAAGQGGGSGPDPVGLERAAAVQERHSDRLIARHGIVGTAVGREGGQVTVRVFALRRGVKVPARLDGVAVDADVTGKLVALHHRDGHSGGPPGGGGDGGDGGGSLATTDRWPRPVPIGISTGNEGECSAGTIGARVRDAGGKVFALSNNHIYALENEAPIGSAVLQPGSYDTGCSVDPDDALGTLSDYVELRFDGSVNTVDAAIAATTTGDLGNSTPPSGYGTPSSQTAAPQLAQTVEKFGRTTELTDATVTGLNAELEVRYSSGTARFEEQIIMERQKPFLKSGDSGSLAVTRSGNNPVGLLFAGNSSGKLGVANEIGNVLGAFGVTVDGS